MNTGKDHACHNEEVCDLLLGNGKYLDWVITTAFYAALHFVQYEMFPLTSTDGGTYKSFHHYYSIAKEVGGRSKHKATLDLVHRHLGPIVYSKYKWLHDSCHTARYKNYITNVSKANAARSYLADIKKAMKK